MTNTNNDPSLTPSPKSNLEFLVGEGFTPAYGEVEDALYEWQASARNLQGLATADELPFDVKDGLTKVESLLTSIGLEPELFSKRLNRIGYRYVNPEDLQDLGEEGMAASGAYDLHSAAVIIDRTQTGEWARHVGLHETVHGLAQSQSVFLHQGAVKVAGNGLFVARAHNGDNLRSLGTQLDRLSEATIDILAWLGSGMALDAYTKNCGYSKDVLALKEKNETDPQAIFEILNASFITGIDSESHARYLLAQAGIFVDEL